jgi:hypothetical protein
LTIVFSYETICISKQQKGDIMTLLKEIAEAICLEQFGSEEYYGEARCCQVGGTEGCCAATYETTAQAVIDVIERNKIKKR